MIAGSDMTATAINNALYLFLKDPSCSAKLCAEVDVALSEDDVIAPCSKVKYFPYLKACLDKSLRILQSVSFGLLRQTPKEGTNILGDFIAGDTLVNMSAYVVHYKESC
jgi:cytochrome P450